MPEAAMKPDQERVKNLLTDTVTLLCKNGLSFSVKLRIEGLLGVSIDDNDLFFVHISENIYQNPPDPPLEEESAESPVFTAPESPAKNTRQPHQSPSPSRLVKPEPGDDPDELLIVEEPKPELLERARVVAGQRRAQRRERSPSQQHGWEDTGEPAAKRHMSAEEDENGGSYADQGGGGGWPDLSAVGGDYNQDQVYQQDPGGADFDTTTPGCSTWPTTLATQPQTQDSDGSNARKFPGLKLQSTQIKNALSESLIEPMLAQGNLTYLGFRLMWTNKDNQADEVWNYITTYQQQICEQLKSIPGTVFFLSSITATVTMSTKVVHPGIAFWVGADPTLVQEYQIYTALRNNQFGAELKIITHRSATSELERQLNAVSMAVKDYGAGYVSGKVRLHGPYFRERVYMRAAPAGTPHVAIIQRAQRMLGQLGLVFHLETY